MRLGGHARVNLDSDFRIRSERKTLGSESEKAFHLFGRQIGRRAAAPMELHHRPLPRNEAADVLDFPFQNFDVGRSYAVILGDYHVAGAKQAQALAEGKM